MPTQDYISIYKSLCKINSNPESAIRRAVVRAFNLYNFCPDEDFLERIYGVFTRNLSRWNQKTDEIFFDFVRLSENGLNHHIIGNLIQGQLKINFSISDVNGMALLHYRGKNY
jgi:hypothetical protein